MEGVLVSVQRTNSPVTITVVTDAGTLHVLATSNAEWLLSMPGPDAQKSFLLNCVNCHRLDFITRSHHTSAEFIQVMERMSGYANSATPLKPQRRKTGPFKEWEALAPFSAPYGVTLDREGYAWTGPMSSELRVAAGSSIVKVEPLDE